MEKKYITLGLAISLLSFNTFSSEITASQSKELAVFSGKAMGIPVTLSDIKNPIAKNKINELVATGINLNGFLCASVEKIHALKVKATYEVTCIAYRNGSAKKTYIVDALNGVAFEP